MIEQFIDTFITSLGIFFLGFVAWIGLIAWATWYNPDFQTTETRKLKTYITIIVLGLAIDIAFF